MGYTPHWEVLAHTLKRVVDSGVAQSQAKTQICQAIADREIGIRALMEKAAPDVGGKILVGGNIEVPPRLEPTDFDWDKSCPFKPWNTGPDVLDPSQRYFATWPWKPRSIERIEVSTADVVEILCGGRNQPPQLQAQPEKPQQSRRKSRPAFERAHRVIRELYPEGIPDDATLPNAILCRRVGEHLRNDELPHVSDDSILRAAGRRK